MKVIELLSKIANGEKVPKFKYDGLIWKYSDDNFYWSDNTYLDSYCDITQCLNDEVEIIEPQEHKIPEKICTNRIINTKDILEFEMIQNKINAEYTYAINEIIDYINKENKCKIEKKN